MRAPLFLAGAAAALVLTACEPTDDPAIDPGRQQEELTPDVETPLPGP